MQREAIERELVEAGPRDDGTREGIVLPAYDDYCFANVTESLLSLHDSSFDRRLPGEVFRGVETDVDHVVCVLLDGFGYDHWRRVRGDRELLTRVEERGALTPLTSVYPSETAAAITTHHTGRTPIEHGLLGWFQYLDPPGVDALALPFTTLDGTSLAEFAPDFSSDDLFDGTAIYERAVDRGIDAHGVLPESLAGSDFSRVVTAGAERTGYAESETFALTIRRVLESATAPSYVHAYEPTIDAIAHADGTTSERARSAIADICAGLTTELIDAIEPALAERTLLVVTADHGIVDTVPSENVDLSTSTEWSPLQETFRPDEDGDPRRPTGSPRNAHFHVRPNRRSRAQELLESSVDGLVLDREGAIEKGLFGTGVPGYLFDRRCGDLIAVHCNRGLCWRSADTELVGMHGGLTREEMLVPFAAARVDQLQ